MKNAILVFALVTCVSVFAQKLSYETTTNPDFYKSVQYGVKYKTLVMPDGQEYEVGDQLQLSDPIIIQVAGERGQIFDAYSNIYYGTKGSTYLYSSEQDYLYAKYKGETATIDKIRVERDYNRTTKENYYWVRLRLKKDDGKFGSYKRITASALAIENGELIKLHK